MVDDVLKNVNRFVVNNFQDDAKQSTIEVLLGKFKKDQQKQMLITNPVLQALDQEILRRFLFSSSPFVPFFKKLLFLSQHQ